MDGGETGSGNGSREGAGRGKLRLKVTAGNAAGSIIEVEDELVIGRQEPGPGSLANDIEISRRHARIAGETEGRFVVEDLGSTNGTSVNGRRIEGPTVLETGDRIEVGATALVVQVSSQPTPVGTDTIVPEPTEATPDEGPAKETSPDAASRMISLRVDIDMEAGEAAITLDETADEVKLVHEDGRWRIR